MNEKQSLVKLAVDTYRNIPTGNFSKEQNLTVLREALIDLNGGSTKLNYKTMRNNSKAIEMFQIIEDILDVTVMGGLEENPFFQQFVETRNIALGDDQTFFIEDNSIFAVSKIAAGINDIRRQRLIAGTTVTVDTELRGIEIYEELSRVLANRVDFNQMIDKVALSFNRDFANQVYNALYANFSALPATFGINGAYSESGLQELTEHVESSTGKSAIIVGTKATLRNINLSSVSDSQKERFGELGYYGDFYGTPVMAIKQSHAPGSYTWQLTNKDLYVMPVGTKPIKVVFRGENYVSQNDPMNDAAFQMEYKYFVDYGMGVLLNEMYGNFRLP